MTLTGKYSDFITLVFFCALAFKCTSEDPTADGNTDSNVDGDIDSDVDGDADGDADPDCDSTPSISIISSDISSAISTVGIVEWSTTASVSSAFIEFGLDTNYGYTAKVDLSSSNYRTLLLGMKPSSTYHYRIVVNGCAGSDNTIATGSRPTSLPSLNIDTQNASASAGGFIIWESGNYAFILDGDGDFVWWYSFSGGGDGITRAKISADGKSMWAGNLNVQGGNGYLYRISLDGLGSQETLNIDRHHDFTITKDNTVTYIQYGSDGDDIVERSASGQTKTIYSLGNDFSGGGGSMGGNDWSHCNSIHYIPADDAYTISCLNLNNVIEVSRSGSLMWDLEGDSGGDYTGASWDRQHGHHLLDNGNLLIFNNGGGPGGGGTNDAGGASGGFWNGGGSSALEFSFSGSTASQIWNYDGEESSSTLGDVERLPNGNTLVTYSNASVMHEVDSSGNRVRSISSQSGGRGGIGGYADWRADLYGEPYRY